MDGLRERGSELFGRYNRRALATGVRLQGQHFLNRVEEFDELDPEWTEHWLTWIYDKLYNRDVLDHRTRILVVIGEATVLGAERQIANHIRSAMRAGATPEECLEVILQSATYVGMPRMIAAMKIYRALMSDIGHREFHPPQFQGDAREGAPPDWLDELVAEADARPTPTGRTSSPDDGRMLDKEARRADLEARHNRRAVETGIRLQGEFFLRQFEELDEVDEPWSEAWLTFIYDYLYNRNVLDERTRLLVVIGECAVLDEAVQLPNHMRSAIRAGATPREILEVLLQSSVYAGMPRMIKAVRAWRSLMKDLELVDLRESVFRGDARD